MSIALQNRVKVLEEKVAAIEALLKDTKEQKEAPKSGRSKPSNG